jgi:hypothetical protein
MANVTSPNTINFASPQAMIAPDIAAQQLQLQRQQQLADALRQGAITPIESQTVTGAGPARVVPISPFQGLAKLGQAYFAKKLQDQNDAKQLELGKAYMGQLAKILGQAPSDAGTNLGDSGAQMPQSAADAQTTLPQTSGSSEAASMPDVTPQDSGAPTPTSSAQVSPQLIQAVRGNAPAPSVAPNNFNLANLIRGQAIESMGGQGAGAAYWKQFEPTDFTKLLTQAGIDPNSMLGRQMIQGQLAKQNYIAPTRLGEGYYNDPTTGVQSLPNPKSAYATIRDPSSPTGWRTVEQPGGVAAVQAQERAEKLGQTMGTLGQGVDANGNPTYFLGLPPGTAGATNGPSTGATNGFPNVAPAQQAQANGERLAILQNELANETNPANRQALQREIDRTSAAQSSGNPFSVTQSAIRPANPAGYNASQESLATASAKRYNDQIALAADSPTRVNVYDNILNLSQQGVNTGPGEQWKNTVKGYIANTPLLSSVTQGWKDDVSGFQELNKFLYQNAQRNWQAAGGTGTDAQLDAYAHSSPNDKMFPKALQAMAQWGKAGELALQAKTNAMQQWKDANGGNVANQDQFERTWRNTFDPRVFQLNVMPPNDQKAFIAKLSPADAKALLEKRAQIRQMGGF